MAVTAELFQEGRVVWADSREQRRLRKLIANSIENTIISHTGELMIV